MQIFDLDAEQFVYDGPETGIALGNFDGVHLGHQALIECNIRDAREKNLASSVLLFKNHTADLVDRDVGKFITDLDDKIEYLEEMGVEQVFLTTFDRKFMSMSDITFVKDYCKESLKVRSMVVGDDYRFGYHAVGDVADLKKIAKALDICVHVIAPVRVDGERVSSTRIRKDIRRGQVANVRELMGRPYRMRGTIRSGKQRGRDLGYPTANMGVNFPYVMPADGVYLTQIEVEGKTHYALTDIGTNPTFMDEVHKKIETYIFDFQGDIYGCQAKLSFLRFMREDIQFDSVEPLMQQMGHDVDLAREWIAEMGDR